MLEAECMALHQMFANMSKNAQFVASNERISVDSMIKENKEGDSVHQAPWYKIHNIPQRTFYTYQNKFQ